MKKDILFYVEVATDYFRDEKDFHSGISAGNQHHNQSFKVYFIPSTDYPPPSLHLQYQTKHTAHHKILQIASSVGQFES
jgi:hypothetical protein